MFLEINHLVLLIGSKNALKSVENTIVMTTTGAVQIYCVLTDASGDKPYFLTVNGTAAGSSVALNNDTTLSPGNMWMVTYDSGFTGRIRSLLNNGLVLTCAADGSLEVQPEIIPTPASQQWTWAAQWQSNGFLASGNPGIGIFQINNGQSGYLGAAPATSGPNLAFNGQALLANQQNNQQIPNSMWCMSPNPTLLQISQLPYYNSGSAPSFPAFTDGQDIAYRWISDQIYKYSNNDIRSLYTNSALDWSDYYTKLSLLQNGSGALDSDFDFVQTQLESELEGVQAIINVITFTNGLSGIVGDSNQTVLSNCCSQAGTTDTSPSDVGAAIGNALETIGLSVLSALGGAAGTIAAGIIQAGVGLAQTLSDGTNFPPPGPTAISNLWTTYQNSVDASIASITSQFTSVQTDWNQMQIFYAMGGNWPVTLGTKNSETPDYQKASKNGLIISAMQSLMPAFWQVYELMSNETDAPSGATIYTTSSGRSVYLADVDDGDTFPTADCINLITGAGVVLEDLLQGNNGWYLGQAGKGLNNQSPDAVYVRLAAANQTPNTLTVNVYETDRNNTQYTLLSSHSISPNESWWYLYPEGTYYAVEFVDPLFNTVRFVSVNIYMDLTAASGGDVIISEPTWFNNGVVDYAFATYYGWEAHNPAFQTKETYSGSAVFCICLA